MPEPTASQTIGPFFRHALERPAWSDLTAGTHAERIRISGRVFDGDGDPVHDALLEIWQANGAGKFAHPDDSQQKPLDAGFRGFGRACTDAAGAYAFTTVMPGSVPAGDGRPQAPHLNLAIFARGLLKRLVTRIYFSDRAADNAVDPLLQSLANEALRATLIGRRAGAGHAYQFDVHLQGEDETVFLEV